MRLLGRASWSRDDYRLAYAIKQGYVSVPRGSLWDPMSYVTDNNKNLHRGLFNVRRFAGRLTDPTKLRHYQDPFPDLPKGPDTTNVGTANALGLNWDTDDALNTARVAGDWTRPMQIV